MSFSQTLCLEESLVDAMQSLLLCFRQERIVLDVEQVVHDKPNRFLRGHPVLLIEALEIDWNRISPQSALPPEIEIDVEITQRRFPQRAIHGFAPAAPRVIGFDYGPQPPTARERG